MSIRSARPVSASDSPPTAPKPPATTAVRPLQRPVTQVSKSRPLRMQLEQLKAKVIGLENRRQQTLSPVFKQGIENQIKALQKQVQTTTISLLQAQSQERLSHWPPLLGLFKLTPKSLENWESVSDVWHGLYPPDLQIFLESARNQRFAHWQKPLYDAFRNFAQGLAPAPTDWALPEELTQATPVVMPQEQNYWQESLSLLLPLLPALEAVEPIVVPSETSTQVSPPVADGFQVIAFELPPSRNDRSEETVDQVSSAQKSGAELEVRFDMGAGKSLVRNSMGIVLNQEKKTYQEYLDLGFACIDKVVDSGFVNTSPLQQAIEVFLEAVSLHKERHEAYFGLGYLYSLVRDLNHSLYFLNLAWKISRNPSIEAFMKKVKESYGLT
ncbi:MAG: hypothetical protein IV090_02325 [Candidatus Sericytochromatia bacterium]|nr:hypothetical protein [Candidatus Sericytochromatia bacterium]